MHIIYICTRFPLRWCGWAARLRVCVFPMFVLCFDAERRLRPSPVPPQINERDSVAETSQSIRVSNRRWNTPHRRRRSHRRRPEEPPDESRNDPGRPGLPTRGNPFGPIVIIVVIVVVCRK